MKIDRIAWYEYGEAEPHDGQDCLIYSACQGYSIAKWLSVEGVGEFYHPGFKAACLPVEITAWAPLEEWGPRC